MDKLLKIFDQYDWVLLVVCALCLCLGFLLNNWKLGFFVFAGISSGWFFGKNNNTIWSNKEQPKPPREKEKIHNYWIHLIGGFIGGLGLYFLLSHICFQDPQDIFQKAGLTDLVLFLITLLGFTGYIPRILWSISNRGGTSS